MPTKPPGTPDLDLTDPSTWGIINDAVFMTGALQPAGSGNNAFNAFVQIQQNGTEQGYNTDASAQYDEKSTAQHNHSVLLADVPIVFGDGSNGTIEGLAYREFLLDLNEQNGGIKPYISLDKLQIWQEEAGDLTNFTAGSGFAGAHTNYLAYDLDAGGDRWIALDTNMAHGSGESDYRILIPDSFFINDAAHRYVTLYSQFGTQPGWESGGGFEEWGLHGASGGTQQTFSVHKTATVDGGTADAAGEVISYAITVSNVGNTALTGITVSDPLVSDLAAVLSGGFNVGDANLDNQLSVGETWQYTASYSVTQADIDTNGTGGIISNTVTADSAETLPVSASASVTVVRNAAVTLTKTADVSEVDEAGDVIHYTILVQNLGNTTLTDVTVTDPNFSVVTPILNLDAPILGPDLLAPILDGDYNIGDVGTLDHPEFAQNGIEDPGETFQFKNAGDDDADGVEDDGETFLFTNVGDTNQNGFQDDGETFQFYNVGDTDQDGVEDDGETFQFDVSHQVPGVDALPGPADGFNDGDFNLNGLLDVGETWQFAYNYTVTQEEIDNGGVVVHPDPPTVPPLTHDNTATVTTGQTDPASDSVSVTIVQDPRVTITKTADVTSVDAADDVISYTIEVSNSGNMTLTGVEVSDLSVEDLEAVESGGFNAGDDDQDGKLDLTETWQYTAIHTVTQGDIDNGGEVDPLLVYENTAAVTTDQGASDDVTETVIIVQNPSVTITKTADVTSVDAVDDVISYTIEVSNSGNMTLTGVEVSDLSVEDLEAVESGGFNAGDDDQDGKLDLTETWQYTAIHTVTQGDIDNGGEVDPLLVYENTAAVTTDQGASDDVTASVAVVQNPHVTLIKMATVPGGTADANELIEYSIAVTNDGNMTLTDPVVTDTFASNLHGLDLDEDTFNDGDINLDGQINVGETWQYVANHVVTEAEVAAGGSINNTASVTTAEGASDSDSASVAITNPSLLFTKAALGFHDLNNNDVADAGDVIDYSFTLTNNGNVVLHELGVADVDSQVMVTGSSIDLAVGMTDDDTWAATYVITGVDVTAGYKDNDAIAICEELSVPASVHTILASLAELP